ncbi:MAG: hypothetical protein JWQ08_985 [Deinococcus sp.]|nr:hypothetical protein [Deinococcus sp.]
MTDNSNRYGTEPLGKSVEEVEQDAGNQVNSSVGGEDRRRDDETFVPAIVNGNASGVPAILNTNLLVDADGNDRIGNANDGTNRENRDSSEE